MFNKLCEIALIKFQEHNDMKCFKQVNLSSFMLVWNYKLAMPYW